MRKKDTPIAKLSYLLNLTCGCSKVYDAPRPKDGDDVFCRFHGRTTVLGGVHEWSLRCQDCIYSRSFGASEDLAVRGAEKHAGTRIGHRVDVKKAGKLVRTIEAQRGSNPIIDFHRENPTHQTSLRSILRRGNVTKS